MAFRVSVFARRLWQPVLIGAAALAFVVGMAPWRSVEGASFLAPPSLLPAAAYDAPAGDVAVLSGGCFWGMQGVFQHVKGVKQVLAGYAGGLGATANYELVSTGTTGHAKSIKVTFDPAQISYAQILRIYFSVATDPTQVGGQYPGRGDAVSRRDLVRQPGPEGGGGALHRPADGGEGVPSADHHAGRRLRGVLPGRGLSPGLPGA